MRIRKRTVRVDSGEDIVDNPLSLVLKIDDAVANRSPGIRKGQAAFNALYLLAPYLANWIRRGPYDPFYDDERLPAFYSFLFGE